MFTQNSKTMMLEKNFSLLVFTSWNGEIIADILLKFSILSQNEFSQLAKP